VATRHQSSGVGHGLYGPQNPIVVPRSRHEGRLSGVGTLGKKSVTLEPDAFQKANFYYFREAKFHSKNSGWPMCQRQQPK
jgi:hypothetical protein